jgi:peptide/nickel transport system substrate-binding protein
MWHAFDASFNKEVDVYRVSSVEAHAAFESLTRHRDLHTRRFNMKITTQRGRAFVALGTAALTVAALSACTSGGKGAVDAVANSDPTVLTIGATSDPFPVGYDPGKYAGSGQLQFLDGFYEALFTRNLTGPPTPGLVTSFSYSADNVSMTLNLKSGVTFSDGSVLDADLVKANLDRRTDPSLVAFSTIGPGGGDEVASVATNGTQQVILTFTKPITNFDTELTGTAGMIVGKSAIADPKTLAKTPDGSGPYKLDVKNTIVGSAYALDKNDASDASAAYGFKRLVFKPITDPQARLNALISGQLDTAPINFTNSDLAKSKGLNLVSGGGVVATLFPFDKVGKVTPAFGEEKVRQALQLAIDRKGLVAALHKGDLPAWNALPAESPGFDPALNKTWAYDAKKAKQMIADAGYPNGFSFTIVIDPSNMTDMQAVQKYFAAVGVTMNIKLASSTAEGFDSVTKTPLGYTPNLAWTSATGNMSDIFFGFANPWGATDPALTAAVQSLDQNGSKDVASLKALNDRLIESGWDIPLYEITSQPVAFHAKKLKDAPSDPADLLSKFVPAK